MSSRRRFLHGSMLMAGAAVAPVARGVSSAGASVLADGGRIVSTWDFGVQANQVAWNTLQSGASTLDVVEAGARWVESELCNSTVGHCGNPDRDGVLTLDASIMDGDGRCGSVAALEDIDHPVSVACNVMEVTPHVMLVGAGAQQFAVQQGFQKRRLFTPQAEQAWQVSLVRKTAT